MSGSDQRNRSMVLDLRLAADSVEKLEVNFEAKPVGDVVGNARTKLLELPSSSGTASQMESLVRINKLAKATERSVADIAARRNAISSQHPGTTLEDGAEGDETEYALEAARWQRDLGLR